MRAIVADGHQPQFTHLNTSYTRLATSSPGWWLQPSRHAAARPGQAMFSAAQDAIEIPVGHGSVRVDLVTYRQESTHPVVLITNIPGVHRVQFAPVRASGVRRPQPLHRGEPPAVGGAR